MAHEDKSSTRLRRPIYSYLVNEENIDKTGRELTVTDILSGFGASTGLHGVPNAYNAYGYLKKILWTCLTLAMLGLTINNIYENTVSLFSWEVNVNVDITTVRELDFPSVTICNLNAMKLSALPQEILNYLQNSTFTSGVYDSGPDFGTNSGLGTSKSSRLSTQEVVTEILVLQPLTDRLAYGYSLGEFMLQCDYSGYDCSNPEQWQTIYNWKFGNCYSFNVNQSMTRLTSNRPGPDYGLSLVLNTEVSEYVPTLSDKVGVRVVIHDHNSMPFPDQVGVNAAPGSSVSIGMRKLDTSRLGGRYGACYDTSIHNYSIDVYQEIYRWTNYTLSACQKTCWQNMVINDCDCFDANYPAQGQAFTSSNKSPCSSFNKTQADCLSRTKLVYLEDSSCTQCIRPCNQTSHSLTMSTAVWPAPTYEETVLSGLNQNLSTVQKLLNGSSLVSENLVQLQIYFEELNYESITETAAYTTFQYLSDLGGAFGLWLGASVLSLGELLEVLADAIGVLVARHCFKKPAQNVIHMKQVNA